MDRETPFRNVRNAANIIATAAVFGDHATAVNGEASSDYIYVPDVAEALRLLLLAPSGALAYNIYNIAYGSATTVYELLEMAKEVAPHLSLSIVRDGRADIKQRADQNTGRWGAFDIARVSADVGWRPKPLREAIHDYIAFLRH